MRIDDSAIERKMGRLLLGGILLAAAVMICGGALYVTRHRAEVPDYRGFRGVQPELKSISGILAGAAALRGREIIQLAVLLIVATPVLRVIFAIAAFAAERDWLYTAVSALVFAILLYALFA